MLFMVMLDWRGLALACMVLGGEPPEPAGAQRAIALARNLNHAESEERLTAARELLLLTEIPTELLDPLQAALKCPEAEVRQVAALMLARMGKPAQVAAPALEPLVRDPEARVRAAALTALVHLAVDPAGLRPLLVARLEDPDAHVRQAALLGLAAAGPSPNHVGLLRARLRDADPHVRRLAAFALGKWGPAALPAVSALEKLCLDPDLELRYEAAWALFRINRSPAAVELFRAALTERRPESSRVLATFLADNLIEGQELAPLVRTLLETSEGSARGRLLDLLPTVPSEAQAVAAAYLVSKLGEAKWEHQASSTLTRLGQAALPALRAAAAHAEPQEVRERAGELIRRIERPRPSGPRRPPN